MRCRATHPASSRAAIRRGSMTTIRPGIPASTSIPGTAVDFPEPVGAFSSTRARSPRTASNSAASISTTGNLTPPDVADFPDSGHLQIRRDP